MLEYIVTGQVRTDPCDIVTKMEKVVSETKRRAEITERYMQKWDEIEHIKRDGREEVNRLNKLSVLNQFKPLYFLSDDTVVLKAKQRSSVHRGIYVIKH